MGLYQDEVPEHPATVSPAALQNLAGSDDSPEITVGSTLAAGAGNLGHSDQAGPVYEWAFD